MSASEITQLPFLTLKQKSYYNYSSTAKGQLKTTPNFTALSMNSLPSRVAGRKGDKPPKKKAIPRRACLPDDQRCMFNPSSSASCPDTVVWRVECTRTFKFVLFV
jgi:hypothetical protein